MKITRTIKRIRLKEDVELCRNQMRVLHNSYVVPEWERWGQTDQFL